MPSTNQSVVIDASISDVWKNFTNFHVFSWAPNVITDVEKVGDIDGGSVGAKRVLNGVFHETLVELDDDAHILRYSIDDGPPPVSKEEISNYIGCVQLSADQEGGGILVEWTSSWDSNSDDAVEFCQGIYVALLGELANSFSQ